MLLQQPSRPVWAQVRFEHDEAHKSDEACGEYDDEKDEDVHMWQRKAKRLVPRAEQLSYRHRVTDPRTRLNPVSFDWRATDPDILAHYPLISRFASSTHSIGLIAQQVMPVVPDALSLETVGDDQVQYYQLDYTKFIPHLIGAIKEIANLGDGFKTKLLAWFADTTDYRILARVGTFGRVNTDELCTTRSEASFGGASWSVRRLIHIRAAGCGHRHHYHTEIGG